MKPADFFIGVRQLLGVVIPGLAWVISISLGIALYDPIENLDRHSGRELIAVLLSAYLLGLSLRGLSFRFGITLSYWLHCVVSESLARVPASASFLRPVFVFFTAPFRSPLLADIKSPESAEEPVRKLALAQLRRLSVRAGLSQREVARLRDSDYDEICQQFLLGRDRLAQRVEETQAEVELYASMLLPTAVLVCSLLRYWQEKKQVADSFFGGSYKYPWLVGLLILVFFLAWKLQLRRMAEQMDWYRMTIAVSLSRDGASSP